MDVPATQQNLNPWPSQIVVIGCGGVGSYLLSALLRTVRNHAVPELSPLIVLVDGDTLEPRNMERQLFTDEDIGKKKSEALLEANHRYYGPNLAFHGEFFTGGEEWLQTGALVFACVDNHPGRVRVLDACDRATCDVIVCGNGYTDAEAMFYTPSMRGTKHDPRILFPEILTTHGGDPLSIGVGCTGESQQATPQLAIANFLAAAYALHLMWFHYQEAHKLDAEFRGHAPLRHSSNASKLLTQKLLEVT